MLWERTVIATPENPVVGDIHLDATGDVGFLGLASQGANGFHQEVAQRLRSRFRLFKGEWYLDGRKGVPYYQRILGRKDVSDRTLSAIFGAVIQDCPGVSALESIQVVRVPAQRAADIRFAARLTDGFILDSRTMAPFIVRA